MTSKRKPPAASTVERAKDTALECNNITLNTVVTSNAQFLSALFDPDDTCWITRFRENPSDDLPGCWGGHSCQPGDAIDAPGQNAYFSVATFKGSSSRAYANFSSLPVVVLDDAQECQLDPTWLLRTSPGKVQVGYRLSEPVGDLGIAKRLHEKLAKAGHIPLDRNGNNPVRYVRLPIGANTKHEPPFICRLEVFHPNKTYSLTDLIEGLGLDAAYILHGKGEAPRQSPPADGTFPEGSRNTTLTSFAGSMRRRGMSQESILAALTIENATRCFPPLPESEIATIARSVAGYAPADVPSARRPTPGRTGHGFEAPYLSAVWDDDPAVDWMIYGFLENETIAELWGLSGAYKTFVALDAGTAVASGHDYHGKKVMRQGPVLYIPGEGRKGAMRRLKVLCQERGLGRDLQIRISNRPVLLAQADQAEWLLAEIAKFDVPPALIIIDTLARNFGGNENSTQDMGAFVDSVTTISREIGATVLIIHHCGYDDSHARGAYALYAGIDAEYQVIRDGNSVRIINKKMKEAEEGKIIYLNAKVVELKNEITGEVTNDGEGKPITSIVLHSGGSERAALQNTFLEKHPSLKSTQGNKYKERLPKALQAAFDNPSISARAMAAACGTKGHDWVKGLQKLMCQEGLIEGDGFKLTGAGKEAACIFCERADFQMNANNLPKKPFPPNPKSDLL